MVQSAHQNQQGEWVIPQIYFVFQGNGKKISRQKLLKKVADNETLQEAMRLSPQVKELVEEAMKERCVPGYSANGRFYDYYKPRIVQLVGWETSKKGHPKLQTPEHYDAVYEAVYELLPGDEFDLYADGIMPIGMFCPTLQEKYGREYP